MATTLPLRCACGAVRGVARDVSPSAGSHIVCTCDDCQAYAAFLGPSAPLDDHGGTEVFQMAPARLAITGGAERLACVRLSERGLLRWYAGCCRTPVANTLPYPRVPFVGLACAFLDPDLDAAAREAALGPVRYRVFGRFARGGVPEGAHPSISPASVGRLVVLLAGALLRGQGRPTPFFDAEGRPVVEPRVLSPSERAELAGV